MAFSSKRRGNWIAGLALAVLGAGCAFQTDEDRQGTILFLGNSITRHDSLPEFGWTQVNGMAATEPGKDYVHQTMAVLAERGFGAQAVVGDRDCDLCDGPIDEHSRNAAREVRRLRPLAVVVQLGENSDDLEVAAGKLTAQYRRLLQVLDEAGAKRVLALSVWHDTSLAGPRNLAVRLALADHPKVRFLDLTALSKDPLNYADTAKYGNDAVRWHPGDRGMRLIAERVAAAILEAL